MITSEKYKTVLLPNADFIFARNRQRILNLEAQTWAATALRGMDYMMTTDVGLVEFRVLLAEHASRYELLVGAR